MAAPCALEEPLTNPVSSQARLKIVPLMWPRTPPLGPHTDSADWDAFFTFYAKECGKGVSREEGRNLWPRNHNELLQCIHVLRAQPSRDQVRTELQLLMTARSPHDVNRALDGTILFIARLLAMVNIGEPGQQLSTRDKVKWNNVESFPGAVHSHFAVCSNLDPAIVLDSEFTARKIEQVASIGLEWTENLVDHLRLVKLERKVLVFHHASFLKHMKDIDRCVVNSTLSSHILSSCHSGIFPDGFVQETLDTLRLLFPSNDAKTKRWLEDECRSTDDEQKIDLGIRTVGFFKAGDSSSRSLQHFQYWGDRLESLHQAAESRTRKRWDVIRTLRNRKDPNWVAAWAAIIAIFLTVFFGLVQSIEGAIQVYKAW
jgi:hypothetical protein